MINGKDIKTIDDFNNFLYTIGMDTYELYKFINLSNPITLDKVLKFNQEYNLNLTNDDITNCKKIIDIHYLPISYITQYAIMVDIYNEITE